MNTKEIRKDFPFLNGNDSQLIFFDSASTAQKPQVVLDAMADFYKNSYASPHRGIYKRAELATFLYGKARTRVAQFLNAAHDEEIVFTPGTTAGINMVATSWGHNNVQAGDEIILSDVEHHANFLPWQRLAEKKGLKITYIKLNTDTFELIDPVITPKTKLLAVTQSSNVLGPLWKHGQLEALIEKVHAVGGRVLIDAAQSAPHVPIDVQKLNPDFLVFSGHKTLGPTGIGVLYIKKEVHESVEPHFVGGSMVHSVKKERSIWEQAPLKFEAGTVPVAQAIGLHAALDYLQPLQDDGSLAKHEAELTRYALEQMDQIEGVRVIGNRELLQQEGHLISFVIDGLHAHDVAEFLAYNSIAVRAGHHCAQPLAELLGIAASLRVSFYVYNTRDEVDTFISVLKQAIEQLRSFKSGGDRL